MEAPIFVGELELTEPIAGLTLPDRKEGPPYTGARILVRMQTLPVGYLSLPASALDPAAIAGHVWPELAGAINTLRSGAGLAPLAALPAAGIPAEPALAYDQADCPQVSVVLCTRNRPDSAVVTLRGLTALPYPSFEVVVVDNAPSSDATREAVLREFGDDPRVRYVREPRPGLSCARNRGVREAAAEIIAFTDDDVRVDPWWLHGIARGFRAVPGVGCVTGLVATAEIENPVQLFFDLRAAWGTIRGRRVYDLAEYRDPAPLYPYAAGGFGAGANFALSRKVLDELGEFDEALGAGTPSGGGEDMDMFVRVILGGYRLVHEPSAIVSHYHRSELAELEKQMKAYGTGTTAAIAAILLKSPRARREIPPKVVGGVRHVFALRDRTKATSESPSLPAGVSSGETAGMLTGPWLYLKGRYQVRRSRRLSAAAQGA